jgi:hypothetical protein
LLVTQGKAEQRYFNLTVFAKNYFKCGNRTDFAVSCAAPQDAFLPTQNIF